MAKAKPNTIVGQFLPHRADMLESAAWGDLTLTARRALDRIEIEHMAHGGAENGNLVCTYSDFERFGVRRKSVAAAIEQLVELGFLAIAHKGRGGNVGEYRQATRYRLTYLSAGRTAPSDDWKRRGRHPAIENKNKIPGAKTPPIPGAKTPPVEPVFRGENAPTGPRAKTPLLSISREDAAMITEAAPARVVAPPPVGRVNVAGQAGGFVPLEVTPTLKAILEKQRRHA